MSEITKEILTQAVKDYSEAVKRVKRRRNIDPVTEWLYERKMGMGLCQYFHLAHHIRNLSEWGFGMEHYVFDPVPHFCDNVPEIRQALTVRLNFLKTKLAEMENQN